MSWASRRRFIIVAIIGAVIFAFLAILSIATFYKAPTCSDGVQNQGEAGIDCGGPCPYLCTEQAHAPTVLFTKALSGATGRTDIVASIDNINATAGAKNVPYTVTLYGAKNVFIQQVSGVTDLPPASTVSVFIPNITSGSQKVASAFLVIDPSAPHWIMMTSDPRILPVVSNTALNGTADSPRIDAVLTNASVTNMTSVLVLVLVHNSRGDVIAASQTVIPTIPAQGESMATFTWNNAFTDVPASIEVIPVIPLP